MALASSALLALLLIASNAPEGAAPRPAPSGSRPADPTSVADPLLPSRPALRDLTRQSSPDWVVARPGFQHSRSAEERGGVQPCAVQDVDTSGFHPWKPLGPGKVTWPRSQALNAQGSFDLVVHFHGEGPALRELILSRRNFVLYTLVLDPSRSYAPLFSGTGLFLSIVQQIEKLLSEKEGRPAQVGRIALSAWSAGFEGARAVLYQPEASSIDAVILIDGLHGPRDPKLLTRQLKSFIDFARRAAAEERFMLITHSSIETYTYASTTESAHRLIAELGGSPEPVRREDVLGLELVELFSRGNLHVRGYAGNDKADHCSQLGLLRDAYAALGRRWGHT